MNTSSIKQSIKQSNQSDRLYVRAHMHAQQFMRELLEDSTERRDGTLLIPQQIVAWMKQMLTTPYDALTKAQKDAYKLMVKAHTQLIEEADRNSESTTQKEE